MILLLVVMLAGCTGYNGDADRPEGDKAMGHRPGVEPSGLDLALTAAPLTTTVEQTLTIDLTVTNPGPETLTVGFTSGCLYGFALWTENGERAAPEPPICTMNAPLITYEPGEVVRQNFTWTWDGRDPAPGSYELRAGLGRLGEVEWAPPVKVILESD